MGTLKAATVAAEQVSSAVSELRPMLTEDVIPAIGHSLRQLNETNAAAQLAADEIRIYVGNTGQLVTDATERMASAVELACWTIAACALALTVRELFR